MTDGKAEAERDKYVQMSKSVLLQYLVEIRVNVWLRELVKFTALSFLIQKYIRFFQLCRLRHLKILFSTYYFACHMYDPQK